MISTLKEVIFRKGFPGGGRTGLVISILWLEITGYRLEQTFWTVLIFLPRISPPPLRAIASGMFTIVAIFAKKSTIPLKDRANYFWYIAPLLSTIKL
jgi:hypothetical protein